MEILKGRKNLDKKIGESRSKGGGGFWVVKATNVHYCSLFFLYTVWYGLAVN